MRTHTHQFPSVETQSTPYFKLRPWEKCVRSGGEAWQLKQQWQQNLWEWMGGGISCMADVMCVHKHDWRQATRSLMLFYFERLFLLYKAEERCVVWTHSLIALILKTQAFILDYNGQMIGYMWRRTTVHPETPTLFVVKAVNCGLLPLQWPEPTEQVLVWN